MKKSEKIELAKGVAADISKSTGMVVASYKGLTFHDMDKIRRSIKESGNDFRVIKNSLLKKALISCNIEGFDPYLVESTALVLVNGDFAAAAKSVKKYAKDYANFQVKVGYMDGQILDEKGVLRVADLPSREELLSQALATMNNPVKNFVSLLPNVPRGLLNVLTAIKEQKEA